MKGSASEEARMDEATRAKVAALVTRWREHSTIAWDLSTQGDGPMRAVLERESETWAGAAGDLEAVLRDTETLRLE